MSGYKILTPKKKKNTLGISNYFHMKQIFTNLKKRKKEN